MKTPLKSSNLNVSCLLCRPWWRTAFLKLFLLQLHIAASAQSVDFKPVVDTVADSNPAWRWAKPAGGPAADQVNSVVSDKAGNIYMVGAFRGTALFGTITLTSQGETDIFVAKYDAAGHVVWVKQAGGTAADQASHVTADAAGNVYVAGTFTGSATIGSSHFTSQGNQDLFIAKYTATGDFSWAESAGGIFTYGVSTLATDATGNVYISGFFSGYIDIGAQRLTGRDTFIAKYNAAGNLVYAQKAGGTTGLTFEVAFDPAGNAYATGSFDTTTVIGDFTLTITPEEYVTNVFIAKYDAVGNVQWAKQSTNPGGEGAYGNGVTLDAAGNVYISGGFIYMSNLEIDGITLEREGESNAFLLKYTSSGQLQWGKVVFGGDNPRIDDLDTDAAGNLYFAVSEQLGSNSENRGYYLKKYDAAGHSLWQRDYSGGGIITDTAGHLYVSEGGKFTLRDTFGRVVATQNNVGVVGVIAGPGSKVYVAGNFRNTATFSDVTLTSKGATDIFLAEITFTDAYLESFAAGAAPYSIAAADFNGDRISDIITGNFVGENVSVLLGKGTGSVAVAKNTFIGGNLEAVITADFNRDGKADIATLNFYAPIVIALGDGTGAFAISQKLDNYLYADNISAADFNGDGKPDIVTNDFNYALILLGDGAGSFAAPQKYQATATLAGDDRIERMAVADFNGDGRPDIVTSHGYRKYLSVLFNKGGGAFAARRNTATEFGVYEITAADVNDDGKPDIIAANSYNNILSVFLNEDQGSFAAPKISAFTADYYSSELKTGDFNSDGKLDIAFPQENAVSVMLGDGAGAFAAPQSFGVGSEVRGITVADFNGDGKPDLAAANSLDNSVSILLNTSRLLPVPTAWNLRYGGSNTDRFTTVIQTTDGGYLSGGYSNSGASGDKSSASKGGADYWIIKTNKDGAKQWDKTYGGPAGDYLNRIIQTSDGGYLLAGSSASGRGGDKTEASRGSQDYWIVKISNTGEKQWDKTYGGRGFDDLRKVNQLANGDYILAGTSNSPVSGDKKAKRQGGYDYWVVRLDASRTQLWDKTYGGVADDLLESFAKTPDGGFLLAGSSASGQSGDKTQVSKGLQDYWLVKIDGNGVKFWDKTYGGSGQDKLYSIGRTTTGEFFVAGHSSSGTSGDKTQASQGGQDYWMLKLSPSGEKLWDKSFGGSQDETLRAIIQTPDGGYILAGSSASGASGDKTQASQGGTDYWLIKTDRNGNKAYDQRFGGAGEEELRYIERTADGGYILGGRSDSGAGGDRTQPSQGGQDYWLVKVVVPAPSGNAPLATSNVLQTKEVDQTNVNLSAYPNPFTEQVTVNFAFAHAQAVTIKLYNAQGREVATLYQGEMQANQAYEVQWQPRAEQPAGIYLLRVQTPAQTSVRRLVLRR